MAGEGMILRADVHYTVIEGQDCINGLGCNFCSFAVSRREVGRPRSSRSGLGIYNRMRGDMVKHIHANHPEVVKP